MAKHKLWPWSHWIPILKAAAIEFRLMHAIPFGCQWWWWWWVFKRGWWLKSSRLIVLHNTKFGKSLKWKLPQRLRKVFEVHLAKNSVLSHHVPVFKCWWSFRWIINLQVQSCRVCRVLAKQTPEQLSELSHEARRLLGTSESSRCVGEKILHKAKYCKLSSRRCGTMATTKW